MILTDLESLAEQAEEARKVAENERDPGAKAWLVSVAAEYERQAKLAAQREAKEPSYGDTQGRFGS